MGNRGLNPDGTIAREGSLDRVPAAFGPVVDAARALITATDRMVLSSAVARRLVRAGFTLVMPRWGGWTSDLDLSAELFGRYYPERAGQMRMAAVTAPG
jgi:hypothetical protein